MLELGGLPKEKESRKQNDITENMTRNLASLRYKKYKVL